MTQHSDSPTVSCVIAVYNGQAYLRESIDSLLAQEYPHVEIVVVDDGSTDGTAGVIEQYGDRIRAIHQPNAGVSAARNRGVAASSGQLLCFLDADDLLDPCKISKQVDAFDADNRLDLCDCHASFFWSPEMSADALRRDVRHAEPFWHKPLPGHISTWLFRRDLWDRVGEMAPGMHFSEDVDWISRARDLPMRQQTLPDILTHRRLHPNNVTAKRGVEQVAALADTLKAHLTRMAQQEPALTVVQKDIPASEPPLADTLRLLLPCADTALLLKAALLSGQAVRDAWLQWRQNVRNPKAFLAADRVGIKRHLPLLYRNLVTNSVDMGRDLEPYFRTARAREELRSARYRRFLGEALCALHQRSVDFVIGKGVTVGETIHADPVLRHSHDIDLLVRTPTRPAAADALRAAGLLPSTVGGPRAEPRFDHESGLPVELHDHLYRTRLYKGGLDGVWSRARSGEILGTPVRLIGDTDLLVHAPVHASLVTQRYGLSWIVDIVGLLQRRESDGTPIDWAAVTRSACDTRTALPLYVMYRYLAATFGMSIPAQVIEDLRLLAATVGALEHLVAVDGVRADPRQRRMTTIAQASGWRSRAAIAKAMLLPPPAYLKARHPELSPLRIAMMYVSRPVRFVARQANRVQYRTRRWLASKWIAAQPGSTAAGAESTSLTPQTSSPRGDH